MSEAFLEGREIGRCLTQAIPGLDGNWYTNHWLGTTPSDLDVRVERRSGMVGWTVTWTFRTANGHKHQYRRDNVTASGLEVVLRMLRRHVAAAFNYRHPPEAAPLTDPPVVPPVL